MALTATVAAPPRAGDRTDSRTRAGPCGPGVASEPGDAGRAWASRLTGAMTGPWRRRHRQCRRRQPSPRVALRWITGPSVEVRLSVTGADGAAEPTAPGCVPAGCVVCAVAKTTGRSPRERVATTPPCRDDEGAERQAGGEVLMTLEQPIGGVAGHQTGSVRQALQPPAERIRFDRRPAEYGAHDPAIWATAWAAAAAWPSRGLVRPSCASSMRLDSRPRRRARPAAARSRPPGARCGSSTTSPGSGAGRAA